MSYIFLGTAMSRFINRKTALAVSMEALELPFTPTVFSPFTGGIEVSLEDKSMGGKIIDWIKTLIAKIKAFLGSSIKKFFDQTERRLHGLPKGPMKVKRIEGIKTVLKIPDLAAAGTYSRFVGEARKEILTLVKTLAENHALIYQTAKSGKTEVQLKPINSNITYLDIKVNGHMLQVNTVNSTFTLAVNNSPVEEFRKLISDLKNTTELDGVLNKMTREAEDLVKIAAADEKFVPLAKLAGELSTQVCKLTNIDKLVFMREVNTILDRILKAIK